MVTYVVWQAIFDFHFIGFMLNLCSVALQLCDSFLLSKGKGKHKQIEPQYCNSKRCRLRFDNERTLAGGRIGKSSIQTISIRYGLNKVFSQPIFLLHCFLTFVRCPTLFTCFASILIVYCHWIDVTVWMTKLERLKRKIIAVSFVGFCMQARRAKRERIYVTYCSLVRKWKVWKSFFNTFNRYQTHKNTMKKLHIYWQASVHLHIQTLVD